MLGGSATVPTKNLVRGGADAAMGYPSAGMLDLLKLLGGFAVGLFRLQAAREAEMAFLRQQLLVLKRSTPARIKLRMADRLISSGSTGCSRRCSELRSSSGPRRCCAGIGAVSACIGAGSPATVSAGLQSRSMSAIWSGQSAATTHFG